MGVALLVVWPSLGKEINWYLRSLDLFVHSSHFRPPCTSALFAHFRFAFVHPYVQRAPLEFALVTRPLVAVARGLLGIPPRRLPSGIPTLIAVNDPPTTTVGMKLVARSVERAPLCLRLSRTMVDPPVPWGYSQQSPCLFLTGQSPRPQGGSLFTADTATMMMMTSLRSPQPFPPFGTRLSALGITWTRYLASTPWAFAPLKSVSLTLLVIAESLHTNVFVFPISENNRTSKMYPGPVLNTCVGYPRQNVFRRVSAVGPGRKQMPNVASARLSMSIARLERSSKALRMTIGIPTAYTYPFLRRPPFSFSEIPSLRPVFSGSAFDVSRLILTWLARTSPYLLSRAVIFPPSRRILSSGMRVSSARFRASSLPNIASALPLRLFLRASYCAWVPRRLLLFSLRRGIFPLPSPTLLYVRKLTLARRGLNIKDVGFSRKDLGTLSLTFEIVSSALPL
jgi:hypothetical protein